MNNSILPLFSDIDDFCQIFEPNFKIKQLESGTLRRHRKTTLTLSEVMTIIIWFQQSSFRNFYALRRVDAGGACTFVFLLADSQGQNRWHRLH